MPQWISLAHATAHQAGGGTSSNCTTYHSHTLFSTFFPPPPKPAPLHPWKADGWVPRACRVLLPTASKSYEP